MSIQMQPIGFVHSKVEKPPRHWSISDVEASIEIDEKYLEGLKDIEKGQRIVVLFNFDRSRDFHSSLLKQSPPTRNSKIGVFSTCSPNRPNPIGMSVLDVLDRKRNIIYVKGIDMLDKTPVLDIKPHIDNKHNCPSYEKNTQT
ncbi:tRNA (adenine37-N6)-methyltransferase [Candidatus Magnetomoraceae bacterium gMMP-15]